MGERETRGDGCKVPARLWVINTPTHVIPMGETTVKKIVVEVEVPRK